MLLPRLRHVTRATSHFCCPTRALTTAFEAGGGGRAAQAERLLAASRQAAAGSGASAAAAGAEELTGVIGLEAPLVTFKPGTHTWNTDVPAKGMTAGAVAAVSAPAAAGPLPAPSAPEARPSAARAGAVGSATASMRSSGACAASFTSSALTPVTRNEAAAPQRAPRTVVRKAYVCLHTSHGDLNLELHADLVPRATENFLLLAARGYYDGVPFHRSIRNFMIQGGDPTGTGTGGASAWGRPFADEFTSKLSHSGRGVLSMANSGPHSNGSQFFITFKSAPHLDNKHTVFGRVVGGVETTLSAMERVPTDASDRPQAPITITGTTVFDDPFADAETPEAGSAKPAAEPAKEDEEEAAGTWFSDPVPSGVRSLVAQHAGVGKFLPALDPAAARASRPAAPEPPPAKKARPAPGGFGDFAGW